jgi:hypothetical protein
MRLRDEGHYTIKITKELPKRGNYNWLYAITSPEIDRFYRALPNGKWQEIILGERFDAPSFVVALGDGKTLGKYTNGQTVPSQTRIQLQLRDIAQETINPTLTTPTFSVSLSDISTKEVGAAYSSTLTGNFDRGQILGALDTGIWNSTLEQDKRSGVSNSYDLDGNNQVGNSLVVNRTIVLGNNVFNGVVNYEIGIQPLDSVGGNFSTPLISGNLNAAITISGQFKSFLGFSSNATLTSAQIIALVNGDLSTTKNRNYTGLSAGAGNYLYYCYRESYGDLSNIILDGASAILGAFTKLSNVSVTNSFGIVELYTVYRSNAVNAFNNNSLNFS